MATEGTPTSAPAPMASPVQPVSSPAKSNVLWLVAVGVLAALAIFLLVVGIVRVQAINDRKAAFSINGEAMWTKLDDTTKYKVDLASAAPGTNAPTSFSVNALGSDGLSTSRVSVVSFVLRDPGAYKKLSSTETTQKLVASYFGNATQDAVVGGAKSATSIKVNIDGGQKSVDCISLDVGSSPSKTSRFACSIVKNAAALLIVATDLEKNAIATARAQYEKIVQSLLEVRYES